MNISSPQIRKCDCTRKYSIYTKKLCNFIKYFNYRLEETSPNLLITFFIVSILLSYKYIYIHSGKRRCTCLIYTNVANRQISYYIIYI